MEVTFSTYRALGTSGQDRAFMGFTLPHTRARTRTHTHTHTHTHLSAVSLESWMGRASPMFNQ